MANLLSSSVWLPGVVLLVVAGTSYLIHETAYQTSRPVEIKTRSKQLLIPEDVDARLWQDPLYALDQHLKGEESAKGFDVTEKPTLTARPRMRLKPTTASRRRTSRCSR
jgi:hypothetical protein